MRESKGKKVRRSLDEILFDYKILLEMRMTDKEKIMALCELMGEIAVYYKLYEIDKPKCPLANGLYRMIAHSREGRNAYFETC